MIAHHPDHDMLLDYASGSLAEGPALLVASHLAFCELCREEVRQLESLGGTLLETGDRAPLAPDLLDRVLGAIDAEDGGEDADKALSSPAPIVDAGTRAILPGPLRRFVGMPLESLHWRRVTGKIEEAQLPTANPRFRTALLRIQPGTRIQPHTHDGNEYTLVLNGGIRDNSTEYRRGDVMIADHTLNHNPVATEDDLCICLAVLDAPMRFTGLVGRLINPFIRF